MSEIMTVNGPIDPEDLGFTSMHEHILYDGRVFRRRFEETGSGGCSFTPKNLRRRG